MSEFFAMGGYAFYVWGAYGASALLIVVEVLAVRARRRRARMTARIVTPDALSAATQGYL